MNKRKQAAGFLLLCLCALACLLFSVKGYADSKEYRVDSADFYVELKENGNAVITERWEVSFLKGDFSRFYKDIYKNVTSLEQFSGVDILGAEINGAECERTDSLDRVDYHYWYEENRNQDTIHWFFHAKNQRVSYQITYELKGLVKETDDHIALLSYRFIGRNFPETVQHTTVRIAPPGQAAIHVRYSKADKVDTGEGSVSFSKRKVSGALRYSIAMDASYFEGLTYVPLKTIQSEERKAAVSSAFLSIADWKVWFIILLLIIFVPLWIIERIITLHQRIVYRKALKQNPDYFRDLENELAQGGIHPLVIAVLAGKFISPVSAFIIALLDLCRRQKCYINKEQVFIPQDDEDLSEIDQKIIGLMVKAFGSKTSGHDYLFMLSDICPLLSKEEGESEFEQQMKLIWRQFYKDVWKGRKALSGLQKKIGPLETYYAKSPKAGTYECFSLVERTHYIGYLPVLGIAYAKPERAEEKAGRDNQLYYFCYHLDNMVYREIRNAKNKSRSSGGGCSGCGGGGAD